MEKTEFLNELRMTLSGSMGQQEVNDNVKYYEDYINMQVRMGKSEAEVMQTLGSPRLIARTIMDATGAKQEYEDIAQEEAGRVEGEWKGSRKLSLLAKFFLLPRWAKICIGFGAAFLLLALAFTILKALAPIILVLAIVIFLADFFGKLN